MRKTRVPRILAAAAALCLGASGCSQNSTYQKNMNDANTKGKYKVRLTTNVESVVGICKFMGNVEPEQDPVGGIPKSQYADYFRVQAVLMGADTVLVRGDGKFGEAYVCGPGPLNPDGTVRTTYDSPPQHP
ncbi:MAG TPA: hypothetical protein VMH79_04110 [Thermoanaerobaculia bacterium]|nr:hypothetical protein [Thermoanaerobaculia bacterium]